MMKKRAFITGIAGQDGFYLAEYLLGLGYEVWGLSRKMNPNFLSQFATASQRNNIHLLYGDLRDETLLRSALEESNPDEIYNLAAQSEPGLSFTCPEETMEINYVAVERFLKEVIRFNPSIRFYQASSSEMFGTTPPPQNEKSIFAPVSPYGEAKRLTHEYLVEGGRKKHGLFICSGILFNHESPRRGEQFVTRKISTSLSKIKLGLQDTFSLGNIEVKRDWGFAGDYVKAMHLMLTQKKPEDYVIATGVTHTIREFVDATARALDMGLSWEGSGLEEVARDAVGKTILTINKDYYRPAEPYHTRGDSAKARIELGWSPETTFEGLTEMMAKADYERLTKLL